MNENKNLSGMVRYAAKMMAGTLASRVLGLVREMLTAAFFGATMQLDAFYVAYTLANLARQLLAEGALSAAFVPVFSRTLATDGKQKAHSLARQALTVLFFCTLTVVLIGALLAPLFVHLMAPGFKGETYAVAVRLTRTLFPFLMLMSLSALAMGVLNSLGSFFVPAIAPAFSNAAFIAYLLLVAKEKTVWNLATAVLIGGFCCLSLQWYWCAKMKMPLRPAKPEKDNKDLHDMMALFLPYAAGLSLNQINPVISRMMGSFLQGGSISVLNYADRVLQLPLGLFVIAISQAVLPMLSRIDPENREEFRDFIRDALRFNLFIVLPVTAGVFFFSQEAIHLLFFRGAFNEWAWHSTAVALALYGLGLPGMASSTIILRAMYARRMPRAAIGVTGVTVIVNLCASLTLMPMFKYAGLATSVAIAFTCSSIYGAWALSKNIGLPLKLFEFSWSKKVFGSIAVMLVGILPIKLFFAYPQNSAVLLRISWLAFIALLAAVLYFAAAYFMKCSELSWLKQAAKR